MLAFASHPVPTAPCSATNLSSPVHVVFVDVGPEDIHTHPTFDGRSHAYSVLVLLEFDMSSERKYKNVVLSSGFVNRSAICSLVGTQLMLMMRWR